MKQNEAALPLELHELGLPDTLDWRHDSFLSYWTKRRRQEAAAKNAAGNAALLLVATIATVAFRRSDVLFEDIDPGHINGLDHELLVLIVVHLFSPPFLVGC